MKEYDNIHSNGKWKFDEDVTSVFSNMLERSIPQYDIMRESVFNLGCHIIDNQIIHDTDLENKKILDLGCSNGLVLEKFINQYETKCIYTGIDISEPMINEAKKRCCKYIDLHYNYPIYIYNLDLKTDFPTLHKYNLILSILTIQFIPIEYRQMLIQNIYNQLESGGGFLMVEKVLGNTAYLNNVMTTQYIKMKKNNGYTDEQIERKKLSLEGVLVPMTSDWNKDMLKQAGFKIVDVFWRWMNFEGYICIK